MDAAERAVLEQLMGAMAAGDTVALFTFLDRYRARLGATVRRLLAPFGRHDVWRDPAQVDALVQTAAIVIFDHAGGWSRDGALPWTWAERAIRAELVAWIGHPHDELHPDAAEVGAPVPPPAAMPVAPGPPARSTAIAVDGGAAEAIDLLLPQGPSTADELAWLAAREPLVALLWSAIRRVASPRDTDVHILYRLQKGMGDRSPAHTVGAEFGLAPDNVRQIDLRVRRKLGALIAVDPAYGPLRDLQWLAA